jgi:hypothetical protein
VPDSNAVGRACSKEVESIIPTDKLTMRSTIFDRSENEKIAAKLMLKTPAMLVVNRIETKVE